MSIQLDLFAEPTPAPVVVTGAVATIATLPEDAPHVAEAAALAVTNYNGVAARALQLLVKDVQAFGRGYLLQGHFYGLSYDRAACLANQIAHGTTSERFVPGMELETILRAVHDLPRWLERRDAAIVKAAELPGLVWVRDALLEDVVVAHANAQADYKEVQALGLYAAPAPDTAGTPLTIGALYGWFFQRCRDRASLARLHAAVSPIGDTVVPTGTTKGVLA